MATRRALVGAGIGGTLLAGALGVQLLTAEDAPSARGTLGAGTSNISLPGTGLVATLAGDAGTLDAAGAPDGAVATLVGGAPQWAAPAGASVTASQISDSTSAGRALLTAADTAAQRSALGAAPAMAAFTVYSAPDFTLVNGSGSDTATLVGSQIRFAHTNAGIRHYSTSTRDCARARIAIPSGASRIILVARVATLTAPGTTWDALGLYLRDGADETAAPSSVLHAITASAARLAAVVHFRDSATGVYFGEAGTASYPSVAVFNGQTWVGTRWVALQWSAITGELRAGLFVSSTAPTSPDQFAWSTVMGASGGPMTLGYGRPTWAVVAALQPGGAATAFQFDADLILWVWPT